MRPRAVVRRYLATVSIIQKQFWAPENAFCHIRKLSCRFVDLISSDGRVSLHYLSPDYTCSMGFVDPVLMARPLGKNS